MVESYGIVQEAIPNVSASDCAEQYSRSVSASISAFLETGRAAPVRFRYYSTTFAI